MQRLIASICGALFIGALPNSAGAQPADHRSSITFTAPVEVPGHVLPAGEYEFRLADPNGAPDVVQIRSADGRHVIATLITVSAERGDASADTIVTFEPRRSGELPAIRTWFFPDDPTGREFVYPRRRAAAIAMVSRQPVKATRDDLTTHMTAVEAPAQAAAVLALQRAPLQVAQPMERGVRFTEYEVVIGRLPETASRRPAMLAFGFVLLAIGMGLHLQRRLERRA